ncbi:MAG: hypothetical protein RIQ89_2244 [Bacteroidota bacterium]
MKYLTRKCILFYLLLTQLHAHAQYISRSEPVPYNCPSVCLGGSIVLKVNQIQNLPAGSLVQALVSNPSGSFASGTTTLNCTRYSTNLGATWILGSYAFTSNINDLYFEITIPLGLALGSNYTIKMKSSSGYTSNDLFQCNGGNNFDVTAAYPVLAPVAANTVGNNQWIGHLYTWTPTTSATLSTSALVNAQDFFNPANYKGHVLINNLTFDVNYTASGNQAPGPLNVTHQGTSIPCSQSYSSNFSIQYARQEQFMPGFYRFDIAADDGIRFSLDGGSTWLLSSFFEQTYANSFRSTNLICPQGVCIDGNKNLIIEYFQRPADARTTFTCTPLVQFSPVSNQNTCVGGNATFSVASYAGANYQWMVSNNGGSSYTAVMNVLPYVGGNTSALGIVNATSSMNGYLFSCQIFGSCGDTIFTQPASLSITNGALISLQPQNISVCAGIDTSFEIQATGASTFQWQVNDGTGFVNITAGNFSGINSSTLQISNVNQSQNNFSFQCIITDCNGNVLVSNPAVLQVAPPAAIIAQPISISVCEGIDTSLVIDITNASTIQWMVDDGTGFVNIQNNSNYNGVNLEVLQLLNVGLQQDGFSFQCVITDCNGITVSQAVNLNVIAAPILLTQPLNMAICEGGNNAFMITASGAISFQWLADTGNGFFQLSNTVNFNNVNSNQLQLLNMPLSWDGALFYCTIQGCGNDADSSSVATLNVSPLPVILNQPTIQTVCEGEPSFFSFTENFGTAFQWQIDSGLGFQNLQNSNLFTGVNDTVLFVSNATLSLNGTIFRCIINGCGGASIYTISAPLIINGNASITMQPISSVACIGSNVSFEFSSVGTSGILWEINDGTGWISAATIPNASGINTNQLTFNNLSINQNQIQLRATLTGCNGALITTDVVTLSLSNIATIQQQPQPLVTCATQSDSLFAIINDALNMQWQVDTGTGYFNIAVDSVHSIGTQATLYLQNIPFQFNGFKYRLQFSDCSGLHFTNEATIQLTQQALALEQPSTGIACKFNPVTFTFTTTPAIAYQWQMSIDGGITYQDIPTGNLFVQTNSPSLQITQALDFLDNALFRCVATSCNPLISNAAALELNDQEVAIFIPSAFTPNGDGLNDTMLPIISGVSSYRFHIYNRWGEKIFATNTNQFSWNGNFQDHPVPSGLYQLLLFFTNPCQGQDEVIVKPIQLIR